MSQPFLLETLVISFNLVLFCLYFYSLKQGEAYKKITLSSNRTGNQLAEEFLSTYRLNNVQVKSHFKSCYIVKGKTVCLRNDLISDSSILSSAVSLHECAHALQHKKITLLSIFRIISLICRNFSFFTLLILLLLNLFFNIITHQNIFFILILLCFPYYLFSLLHEIEANSLALKFAKNNIIFTNEEYRLLHKPLFFFLSSYLVNFISAFSLIFYLFMQ